MKGDLNEYTLHLINAKGERMQLPYSEAVKLDRLIEEGKSEPFYADLDWYLSHGYITGEQMWREIENGNIQ